MSEQDDVFVSPEDYVEEEELVDLDSSDENRFIEAVRIGREKRDFDIFGNTIVLHTLSVKETLEAAKVAKEYRDTYAETLALKTAMVALAIDSINDEPFYKTISPHENVANGRFKRLSDNYYSDFVNEVYRAYTELEREQHEIAEKVKKVRG